MNKQNAYDSKICFPMPFPLISLLVTRKKFPEGAAARCCAFISVSVSGWGGYYLQIRIWWRSFDFYFKETILLQTEIFFCHDIQTWSCRPVFLPSIERESPGEYRTDRGRRQVKLSHWPIIPNESIYLLSTLPVLSFINEVSSSAYTLPFEAQRSISV